MRRAARRGALLGGLALALALGCSRCAPAQPPARPDADFLAARWDPSLLDGQPQRGGVLRVRLPTEPASLNLLVHGDLWAARMVRGPVQETLLGLDFGKPDVPFVPRLALSWEGTDDRCQFTFHLRPGVRFHSGAPFTSRDVLATFNTLLDPRLRGGPFQGLLDSLEAVEAPDDLTVRFRFKRPYFLGLRQVATAVPIAPHGALEGTDPAQLLQAAFSRAPDGTGPFRFERWAAGDRIVLARNEAYWDPARRPSLDSVEFQVLPDGALVRALLDQGQLDIAATLAADDWEALAQDPAVFGRYRRFRTPANAFGYVGWNERRPLFADRRVRWALALLFDQDGFNQGVLRGLEERTSCVFYAPTPACAFGAGPVPYDVARAAALLDEAGWKQVDGVRTRGGVPLRFELMMPAGSPRMARLGPVLQQAWAAAGVQVELRPLEWAVMRQKLDARDFDAAALGLGSNDAEVDPFPIWHSSQAATGGNVTGFSDPVADKLIDEGRAELDPAARAQRWQALGRELYDQQPVLFLNAKPELDVVSRDLRGVQPSLGFYDLARIWRVK
jgi:peptide/nickel transport system substrate-binding protein